MRGARLLLLAAMGTILLGCARKVVLHPSLVPARNDAAWNVQRPPRSVRQPSASTAPEPAPARRQTTAPGRRTR
jgi:hypothetical protein